MNTTKRLTLAAVQAHAKRLGWEVEKSPQGSGENRTVYDLFSNEKALGTTYCCVTLAEVEQELAGIEADQSQREFCPAI